MKMVFLGKFSFNSMSPFIKTASALLVTVLNMCFCVDGSLTKTPNNTEVLVGGSVRLECSTSEMYNVVWQHFPVGSTSANYVFENGHVYLPYSERFQMDKNKTTGRYDLVIPSVRKEDAGTYRCMDMAGQGEDAEAELIVLDSRPQCDALGVHYCEKSKTDVGTLCTVSYTGNIAPKVECSGSNIDTLNRTVIQQQNKVIYHLQLTTQWPISDCACRTMISKIPSDPSYPISRVTYLLGVDAVRQSQTHEAVCAANSSEEQCSYQWFDADTNHLISSERTLRAVNNGRYYCSANCTLNDNICQVRSNDVILTLTKDSEKNVALIPGIVIGVATFGIIGAIAVFLILKRQNPSKRSSPSESQYGNHLLSVKQDCEIQAPHNEIDAEDVPETQPCNNGTKDIGNGLCKPSNGVSIHGT